MTNSFFSYLLEISFFLFVFRLFRGICSDQIDRDLESTPRLKPQFLMRFSRLTEQETIDFPNVIIVICNGNGFHRKKKELNIISNYRFIVEISCDTSIYRC